MLPKQESNMLKRVLKTGLHIIFQEKYVNFRNALYLGHLKSFKERRQIKIVKFCKKLYKNDRFKPWFCDCEEPRQPPAMHLRSAGNNLPLLKPVACRTQRYSRSSLQIMTSILSRPFPTPHCIWQSFAKSCTKMINLNHGFVIVKSQ